jgi:hypothetical protein
LGQNRHRGSLVELSTSVTLDLPVKAFGEPADALAATKTDDPKDVDGDRGAS